MLPIKLRGAHCTIHWTPLLQHCLKSCSAWHRSWCSGATDRPRKTAHARASAEATHTGARAHAAASSHGACGLSHDTTVRSQSARRRDGLSACHVHADGDPGQHAVRHRVAQQNVLEEGVEVLGCLLGQDLVVGVGRDLLRVGAVGCRELHLADEVLVEEELPHVRRISTRVRVVLEQRAVVRADDVDVRCAGRVVAREDGRVGRHAVLVRGRESAQERLVDVGGVGAVAVAAGHDARVHTRGVAVPEVEVQTLHRLARVHVDDLDLRVQVDALLFLADVGAHQLAVDVVRTLCDLGLEDALDVASEELAGVRVDGEAGEVGFVAGGHDGVDVEAAALTALGTEAVGFGGSTGNGALLQSA
ncbi:hypothetical protein GQ600_2645 [Phytophthora cactorum]|nr:hypothetical protein GQ600_2645 [Phytophthora cactorum]